jgi:hypothetical protein
MSSFSQLLSEAMLRRPVLRFEVIVVSGCQQDPTIN